MIPLWRLDLDDFGAEIGQQHGAARASTGRREVNDPNAIERQCHEPLQKGS
jgi:hypothetical protein